MKNVGAWNIYSVSVEGRMSRSTTRNTLDRQPVALQVFEDVKAMLRGSTGTCWSTDFTQSLLQ